jgi:predicted transcriptional regulator
MSGTEGKVKTRTETKTAQIARQRRGGVPKELMELSREQARIRQRIREALKSGPLTAPELHAATGLPTDTILWYLMAWKKYGRIVEGEQCEDFYKYALPEEDRK